MNKLFLLIRSTNAHNMETCKKTPTTKHLSSLVAASESLDDSNVKALQARELSRLNFLKFDNQSILKNRPLH